MARVGGLQAGISILLPHVALCIALALAIPRVTAGAIDGVMLGPVALITLAAFEAVVPLPGAAQLWPATRQAARRLFEIADALPAVRADVGESAATVQAGRAVPSVSRPPASNLEFRDLTFRYPGAETPALRHVSFCLNDGARFGIVGPSGAGKSSLAHLALRFWEYATGRSA
jgi:ABC-type transport system involved in cytochrome bd biosynthesis fused ATPase/permease subunit